MEDQKPPPSLRPAVTSEYFCAIIQRISPQSSTTVDAIVEHLMEYPAEVLAGMPGLPHQVMVCQFVAWAKRAYPSLSSKNSTGAAFDQLLQAAIKAKALVIK